MPLIKHPLAAFPLVYLGWAYLFWIPVLLSDSSVWAFPNLIWFLIGGASPVVAGLGLAAANGGKEQLGDLWRRLTDWRRIPGRWWLIILFFWLAYDLAMAGLAVLLGVTGEPLDTNWQLFVNPGPLLFLLVLSFVFPAVEEVGLRGFYLEALQQRFSPVVAGLVNGAVWALWHAPFVFFPGYYANTTFHPELYWWMPMIICHTLLIVLVYNRTGRSILAVLIFHAMMNFTGEWLRISPEMYPFMLFGNLALAALLIMFWKSGRQSPPNPC
ncbi:MULTISPECIES: CPBP family glutamic-type intramembrane protease [unclassified Marinobacter]|uniref:CPBP family glutamic-type intramembrane protease n=1 Tax=unclassified Marinobacter TaxID=83889 RepID=UPI0019263979|nr:MULTISPECIES: type II CAAX endopeptidase family protein [unclassified Marinobacter]MBL3826708.1 CPBP family intramembrane metalloprotease [Marinobacter sp. MC3]MBL3895083.1 CPBP family intramembrane metalloprotease [Marinobacter sp. MW3]